MSTKYLKILALLSTFGALSTSCSKLVEDLVEIGPPINSITTSQVFNDSSNAAAAILTLYSDVVNVGNRPKFLGGHATIFGSLASDDLKQNNGDISPIEMNQILSDNTGVGSYWNTAYSVIYQANSCIEGLTSSTMLLPNVKDHLLSEARILRAIYYLYLTGFFGDVPFVTSTDWKVESQKSRTKVSIIYNSILEDLKYAYDHGSVDFMEFGGDRIRATKWAAAAILARVSLYQGNWKNAEEWASICINSPLFELEGNLQNVFSKASRETILSFAIDPRRSPYNATIEGFQFTPYRGTLEFRLDTTLIQSFEENDLRLVNWVGKMVSGSKTLYYPNKYKIGRSNAGPNLPADEYPVVLRLAEMYLVRSEARYNLNRLSDAYSDLNTIRRRAGLSDKGSSDYQVLFNDIVKEKRTEYFVEYGHRWFDLVRWDIADNVLGPIKLNWTETDKLFPIPISEIRTNPSLVQNPGY